MSGRTKGRIGHLAGIGVLTLLLLWPALWSGAPTAFVDSANYYEGGGEAVGFFLDRTGLDDLFGAGPVAGAPAETASAGAGGGGAQATGAANNVRSVPYSVFLNVATRAAGPMAAVLPMALVTAWLIWLMMAPLRPLQRLAAGAVTALATTLPFYAAQIMPDIQAAWLIAIPLVVMRREGILGCPLAGALCLAATAAILVHYSHIPLAAASGTALGLWFLWRRRYALAALAQLPLVLALAVNLAISVVMAGAGGGGGPADAPRPAGAGDRGSEAPPRLSLAPGRLPVLLARLFEDGVAIRYLSETCPGNGFTICEVYDRFPETSRAVLWGKDNVRTRATPAQMRRISAEEMALAWQVLRYDPWAQGWASAGNTVEQILQIGFSEMRFAEYRILGPDEIRIDLQRPPRGLFPALETVQALSVLSAALALLALVWRVPEARAPVALLAVGLLANAFVCGALSAPAGRYQGRVIWLVVAMALALAPLWPRRPPGRT